MALQKLAVASNKFSLELHKSLCKEPGNIFYSPLSVSTALAMLYHGTRGISQTEMREVLNYNSQNLSDQDIQEAFNTLLETTTQATDYILNIANSIFIGKGSVDSEYLDILKKWYQAEARNVNFAKEGAKVKEEINSWVADKTNNKIKNLIKRISPVTVLILVNAVYFKGTWRKQFNPESTVRGTFYNNGLESSRGSVPMMRLSNEKFRYVEMEEGFKALELPYVGSTSMWILLPNKLDGITELENQLSSDILNKMFSKSLKVKVLIRVPKFKLEFDTDLVKNLEELGMPSLFNLSADLTGLSKEGGLGLFVSQVLHKAYVEVNEEGSEAAAATAVIIARSMPRISYEFIADHPFMFLITDNDSECILFMGKVVSL